MKKTNLLVLILFIIYSVCSIGQVNNNLNGTFVGTRAAAVGLNYPAGVVIPGPPEALPQLNIYSRNTNVGAGGESFIECRQTTPNAGLGDYFDITNASGSSALFAPRLAGHGMTHNANALILAGDIANGQDNGNNPVINFNVSRGGARLRTASAAIATRPLFGWTNNATMQMMMSAAGNLGIGTGINPITARLHTNGTVRHQNLQNGLGTILVQDGAGNVFNSNLHINQIQGLNNSCSTINLLPKVTSANGDMGCSQIFDDGVSVGINTTGPFVYNATTAAGTMGGPPLNGIARLDVNGVARCLSLVVTSDQTLKKDIMPIKNARLIIEQLNGKVYSWKKEVISETGVDDGRHYGFLAQEVEKIVPEAVITDKSGRYGVEYNAFIPILVESQKELIKENEEIKAENKSLQSELRSLKGRLTQIEKLIGATTSSQVELKDQLFDPVPNPNSGVSRIDYQLAKDYSDALISITGLDGKQLKSYKIDSKKGKGSVQLQLEDLATGTYIYTLFAGEKALFSKRLQIVK